MNYDPSKVEAQPSPSVEQEQMLGAITVSHAAAQPMTVIEMWVAKGDKLTNAEIAQASDATEEDKQRVAGVTSRTYTPSASIGKSWEQVRGVQEAVDAQRIAEGKKPYYYGTGPASK